MRMNRRRAAQEGEAQAPRLRSAPAHLHRKIARQRSRPVPASARRRRAENRPRRGARAGHREPPHLQLRLHRRRRCQRPGMADVLGTRRLRLRHRACSGAAIPKTQRQALLQHDRGTGLEDHSPQDRPAHLAPSSPASPLRRPASVVRYASSAKWEEAAMEPQQRQRRLRLHARRRSRRSGILRRSRTASSPAASNSTPSIFLR